MPLGNARESIFQISLPLDKECSPFVKPLCCNKIRAFPAIPGQWFPTHLNSDKTLKHPKTNCARLGLNNVLRGSGMHAALVIFTGMV